MEYINQKIDTFWGLNNMLNPISAEYREGMAYKSSGCRIDEHGLWTAQPALVGISGDIQVLSAPTGAGNYFKNLAVDDVNSVVGMPVGTSCDVGPNKKLYSTTGTGYVKNAAGNVTTFTPPTFSSRPEAVGEIGSRMEKGTYHYMVTAYNPTYKKESLPSKIRCPLNDIDQDSWHYVTLAATGAGSGNKYRWYRTKRTYAAEEVWNSVNKFYFLGETDGTTFTDRFADSELADYEYEGRGTPPPQDIDYLASFNNRMLYFKGNVLRWSSAGRPEEVAAEYTLTYKDGESVFGDVASEVTMNVMPKLSVGAYAEAKYEIAELSGQKVLAAMPYKGKLYVWTSSLMGYLEATNRLEGYRFHLLRKGVGVTSDKVLALTPYGIFGADGQGVWLLTGTDKPTRLTDNRVDLHAGDGTTFTAQNFANSWGCWIPVLNEYWWGVSGKIIAYQANRNIFAGPYSHAVTGGCAFANDSGAQAYLGGQTPSPTLKGTGSRELQFWLGQSTPSTIKDQLTVELFFPVISSVSAQVIQNCIASATGASGTVTKSISTTNDRISPSSSGQFFRLKLTLSGSSELGLINYKFNAVGWSKSQGR